MSKEIIQLMVEGGKATSGPQLGSSLGPLGINIQDVLKKINEKTAPFKGMKVPVEVIVETKDKSFDLEIGTPPASQLIKKELNLEKGSSTPNKSKIENIAIEQIIKIAKMKQDSMLVNNLKAAVLSIIGSADSLGILIEGKSAKEINEDVKKGVYDKIIDEEKTEVSEDKRKRLKEELGRKQEEEKITKLKEEESKKTEKEKEVEAKEEKVKEKEERK